MPVLVTGAAGFIGFHVVKALLARGDDVVGVDNFNSYYSVDLKRARVATIASHPRFRMKEADIADERALSNVMAGGKEWQVVHLAAQAGVRYSLENPIAYGHSNLAGHLAVLEACRHSKSLCHLVYASSSSVYGERNAVLGPFREDEPVDRPASLYAATKRAGELLSHSYSALYGLPQTGLRFFTAYGPYGRPDMAYYSFTRKILAGDPIEVFGEGRMVRDFTYIDDIVQGILGVLDRPPTPVENRILNIGGGRPIGLLDMISVLEQCLQRKADMKFKPMQLGDVPDTFADISRINALTGYEPKVRIERGLQLFVNWYMRYHRHAEMQTRI